MRHLALSISLLFLLACPALAQDKVDLRLHFVKGDSHSMNLTIDQSIDQTVQGVAQRITQTLAVSYKFQVEDVDDRGLATISLKYENISFHTKTPATESGYDSTQPSAGDAPLAAALGSLVGQSYGFTINPDGQILHVTGLEKLANGVLNHLNGIEGPSYAAMEKYVKQQFSESSAKTTLQNLFAPLPDHPVAIGESWSRSIHVNQGFDLTLETTCTLKSRDNGMAYIVISGHSSSAPGAALDLSQTKFAYNLQGDSHAELQVQESTGWTWMATNTQSLGGTTTIQSPGAAPQTILIAIESKMKAVQK